MDGRATLFYKDGWMDERRCFIRMGGRTTRTTTLFIRMDGWRMGGRRCFIRMGGRTTLFYKDGWMDERRCFIRRGGWTDDVVL